MSAIFRTPVGLLDYLATKAVGQNPAELSQTVVPTINLDNWYQLGVELSVASFTGNVASGGVNTGQNLITVPQNEIWLVRSMVMTYVNTSGNSGVVFQLSNVPSGGGALAPRFVCPNNRFVTAAALMQGYSTAEFSAGPLIARQGEIFQAWCYQMVAVGDAYDVIARVAYTAIRV